MINCSCTAPVKNVPPFEWQCAKCGLPIVQIKSWGETTVVSSRAACAKTGKESA